METQSLKTALICNVQPVTLIKQIWHALQQNMSMYQKFLNDQNDHNIKQA